MSHQAITALAQRLRGHVSLGKSRLDTLCMLVIGMVGARTVNLGHIATAAARSVLIASTCRRLQRFFQHVDLDPDWAAPILARLIGSEGPWTLALDRTTWKVGTRDVNYVVLAVITRRFRVPLFWTLLEGPGNSATATRIALMTRYLAHFPASSVRVLLADSEFIGAEWVKFLNDSNIKFAIRLREDCFAEGEPPVRPRDDRGRLRAHALRPAPSRPAQPVFRGAHEGRLVDGL